MSNRELLQESFEMAAPYISNLAEMRELIKKVIQETNSVSEAIEFLTTKGRNADVTYSTDIRILINKLENLQVRKTSP